MVCVLLIMYTYYNLKNELVFNDYITEMFSNDFVLIMAALWNRAGHYIFVLWSLSFFFFYSLPNLSGRRLDVYHTSTHSVAIVQI